MAAKIKAPSGNGMEVDAQPMVISAQQVANQKQQALAHAQAQAQAQALAQAKMLAAQKQQQMQAQQHMQQQMLMQSKPMPNAAFATAVGAAPGAVFAANKAGGAGTATAAAPMAATATSSSAATAATIASFGETAAKAETDASYQLINVPAHRLSPLAASWQDIYKPIVENMRLQIRFNIKKKAVEMRTSPNTPPGHLQKSADFIRAFLLGFEVKDALALLQMEELYIDSFGILEVKRMEGEHLARAIGRIAGAEGKTKYTIENTTHTRIVIADSRIHILGAIQNIRAAKDSITALIRGSAPGKIYTKMRGVANRLKERA